MNRIIIMGHVGGDPEQRFTPNGKKVNNFSIAVNTKQGGDDQTIWYRVAVWGDTFDNLMQYVKKGSAVIVSGTLRPPRTWVDQSGTTQVSLEINADSIEFPRLGRQGGDENRANQPEQAKAPKVAVAAAAATPGKGSFNGDEDEDLPF